uniref:Uncharacterized protein n=1 Tax=Rhizophora mucronata TaxID=61149 RepID=A0A2P2PV49_RHIMU
MKDQFITQIQYHTKEYKMSNFTAQPQAPQSYKPYYKLFSNLWFMCQFKK